MSYGIIEVLHKWFFVSLRLFYEGTDHDPLIFQSCFIIDFICKPKHASKLQGPWYTDETISFMHGYRTSTHIWRHYYDIIICFDLDENP